MKARTTTVRHLIIVAAIVGAIVIAALRARASGFGDCFQRVRSACEEQVKATYGCPTIPDDAREVCVGHYGHAIIQEDRMIQCGGDTCTWPQGAVDSCSGAATTVCAHLLQQKTSPEPAQRK
jgi:hypothetical protein